MATELTGQLLALLPGVTNPFSVVVVTSAWEEPASDVPAIGASALEACCRLVAEVRRTQHSHGLLVSGQPGTGKTHLLASFRRWMLTTEQGWFVYVPPVASPDRFWRHVLRSLASDILRVPRAGGVTQLETAVARHVMANTAASVEETAHWWRRLRDAHTPGPELHAYLLSHVLEPLGDALALHGGVVRAVAAHLSGVHRLEARDYLLGGSLAEHALMAIGAPETLDDEIPAEAAVCSLLRIAEPALVVVFAFDQIEGLQRRHDDDAPLVAFGHGVAALLHAASNVAVLTCAMVSFLDTLRQAVGEAIYEGRIAERQTSLRPLDGAQAIALVEERMRRRVGLQSVRLALRERAFPGVDDTCWPLQRDTVRLLADPRPSSARTLLKACRDLFDERREQLAGAIPKAPAAAPSVDDVMARALESLIVGGVDATAPVDEGVYADGLVRAFQIEARAGLRVIAAPERDVDLALESAGRRTAVSLCNASNMTSLAGRLKRLVRLADQRHYDRLVWVRDERLPVTATAKAAGDRIAELAARGCAHVAASAEAYAALAAIRKLLADAAAGDLAAGDHTIGVEELSAWLARRLPLPVRDLLDTIAGAEETSEPAGLAALHELLQSEWMLELEIASARSGVAPEIAREAALLRPGIIGYLAGPPEVLFLQPGGFERS